MKTSAFVPRQARIKNEDLYGELATSFTQGVIEQALGMILPVSESSIVHDNGCGTGVVTRTIVARAPSSRITFKANDIEQGFVDIYSALAKEQGWDAEAFKMPAESLNFADCTFDLSIANFLLFMTADDGLTALREMYRTLKPGGTAIFTSWSHFPAMSGMEKASLATRGPDGPQIMVLPPQWASGSFLAERAEMSGFDRDKIRVETVKRSIPIGDLEAFAHTSWSWSGCPTTGWTETDEEKWDVAIDTLLRMWQNSSGFEELQNGDWAMICAANVAIATKQMS